MSDVIEPMSTNLDEDCRWVQQNLEKRIVEGVEASAIDEERVRQHRHGCPKCDLYLKTLDAVATLTPEVSSSIVAAAVDDVDRRFVERRSVRRAAWFAGAAALAAGIAVVLVVGIGDPYPESHPPMARFVEGTALVSTVVIEPGALLEKGQQVSTADNRALFEVETGVELALAPRSEILLSELDPGRIEIGLERGLLAVAVRPALKGELEVRTSAGTIAVTGTVFGVELAGERVEVHVLRGTVRVDWPGQPSIAPVTVGADKTLGLDTRSESRVSVKTANRIRALLGMEVETPAQEVELPSPDLEEQTCAAPRTDPITGEATAEEAHPKATRKQIPSLETVFQQARECRLERDWSCAAERYRLIGKHYPDRPAARSSLVFLAEIELDHLGHPGTALELFGEYRQKASKGPLDEEAAFGACRALRRLGRRSAEKQALEGFVAGYPSSVNANTARTRLEELEGTGDLSGQE